MGWFSSMKLPLLRCIIFALCILKPQICYAVPSIVLGTYAGKYTPNTKTYDGDNGQATSASLYEVYSLCGDTAGNIYIADSTKNTIRMVTASTGIISTIVGNPQYSSGFGGDNGRHLLN